METKRDMKSSGSPLVLWCYCIEGRSEIIACSTKNNANLDGIMLGEMTDTSYIYITSNAINGQSSGEWDQKQHIHTQVSIWEGALALHGIKEMYEW